MKIATAFMAAATLAVVLPSSASAQRWQPIQQRKANIEHRIDMGIRNRSLTRNEASRLRTRFANLQRLEYRYRRNGLTTWERRDLDRRYDQLSRSIRVQRHDWQRRR